MGTYSIFYLMHSPLILIFISVSIFFFTLLGCVFPSHPCPIRFLFYPSFVCSCPGFLFGLGWSVLIGSLVLWLFGCGSFQPLNGQMRDIKQFALASFLFLSFPFCMSLLSVSFGFLLAFFGSLLGFLFFSHKHFIYYYICVCV